MTLVLVLIPLAMYYAIDPAVLNTHYPHLRKLGGASDAVTFDLKPTRPAGWVGLREISTYGKWAIILSEDWNFYRHAGVDYEELKKAINESLRERRFVRGASTISQQVVKNVFLTARRSLLRKAHELILTPKMEERVPKATILEVYLNIAELGPGIHGVRAAAAHYFKKHPSQLNPREAAFLAMLLPSPKRYYTSFKQKRLTKFARSRVKATLQKMKWAKIISEDERRHWVSSKMTWEL